MENNFYVYMYLREDGTPYYVGKGRGYRAYNISRQIPTPKEKSRIVFYKQNLTENEAFQHEIELISLYGRKDLGTGILRNLTDGGEGISGSIRSEETRKKISESNKGKNKGKPSLYKGKTRSEEFKRKISEASKGEKNRMFGKTHSEETRKKISEANKGHTGWTKGIPLSEETKKKMSEANKGQTPWIKGKTHSEETKKKMSEIAKGRIHTEETKKKMSEVRKTIWAERKKLKLEEISKSS